MWRSNYRSFQVLQYISEILNNALEGQVFWGLLDDLLFYLTALKTVVYASDELEGFQNMVFYIIKIGTLCKCADICSQMECLKDWSKIQDTIKLVSADEANLVLYKVTAKEVGIQRSNKLTITFSFLPGVS